MLLVEFERADNSKRETMVRDSGKLIGAVVIAALAFVAGYWPQHQKYLNAIGDLRTADIQLIEVRAHERIYHLENMMLQVLDHTAHKEYKEAQNLTTRFFIEVRADIARPDMSKFRSELQQIIDMSDIIESALQKEDPASRDVLRGVMQQLTRMVGPPPDTIDPPLFLKTTPEPQS